MSGEIGGGNCDNRFGGSGGYSLWGGQGGGWRGGIRWKIVHSTVIAILQSHPNCNCSKYCFYSTMLLYSNSTDNTSFQLHHHCCHHYHLYYNHTILFSQLQPLPLANTIASTIPTICCQKFFHQPLLDHNDDQFHLEGGAVAGAGGSLSKVNNCNYTIYQPYLFWL